MNQKIFIRKTVLCLALLAGLMVPRKAIGGYTTSTSESNGRVIEISAEEEAVTAFNNAQDALISTYGGGTILLKSGVHSTSSPFRLKSDVHLRFEPGVTIDTTATSVFSIDSANVNNSIEGPETEADRPKILLKEMAAILGDVGCKGIVANGDNMKIRNLNFVTRGAKQNIIHLNGSHGLIENIYQVGPQPLHPGWSVIQSQSCTHMDIRNITGHGGFTLRLEQNASAAGTVGYVDLTAENLINYNGRGTVLFAPKPTVLPNGNRNVSIRKVRAYGSGWAVSLGTDGRIVNTTVSDIEAHYGTASQFRKNPEMALLPEEQQLLATQMTLESKNAFMNGPSFGAVNTDPVINDWAEITDVRTFGFPAVYGFPTPACMRERIK